MPRDVSLAISIKDNFSTPLSKASQSLSKLQQDAEKMGDKIDELNRKKAVLTVDVTSAKKELQEAKKAFDGTELSAMRLEKVQLNYDNLTRELRSVTSESKSAEKQLNSLSDTIQKGQNRAGGISESTGGILSKLGQAGATQMIGEVASQAAGAYISSAFGTEASTMFSSVLGMGASGAAIGSMIAPGIGTAIGAGVGGLLGAVSGATQNFQNRDEYFKSMVQEKYSQYNQELQDTLTGGTETAAAREQSMLAFKTLLGSEEAAASFLDELQDFAAKSPFTRAGVESLAKTLFTSGFKDQNEQMAMMTAVGNAGSALGWSEQEMTEAAMYLGRMNSTNKTSLEYLTALVERNIPAVDYLAENLGKSKEEVYDMVSKGLIPGAEAARVIAAAMGEDFAGSMEAQAQTYNGLMSTLEDTQNEIQSAMGQGYIENMTPILEKQIAWFEGESGQKLKDAYYAMGEYQASLEKENSEIFMSTMDEALKEAEGKSGAELGEIFMSAKSEAEAKYLTSDAYETFKNAQLSSIEQLRQNLLPAYEDYGYDIVKSLDKGMKAAIQEADDYDVYYGNGIFGDNLRQYMNRVNSIFGIPPVLPEQFQGNNHASGLMYVPYDGYPARLHEGERILTAREAREYGSGGVNVNVSVNGMVVREEADIDRIAEIIARKVTEARELLV